MEQVKHVIATMPEGSDIERRNRALVAFTLLTGARDSAMASMKLKHVDLVAGSVYQDAREVKTKFSKTFTTFFFPVGDEIRQIVADWVTYLREVKLWGNDDPLFPATHMVVGAARAVRGRRPETRALEQRRTHPRDLPRGVQAAGLPVLQPAQPPDTLVHLGETLCQTPEEFKAWSQNLGHEGVLTTFYSYGAVGNRRQGEIIGSLGRPQERERSDADEIAEAVMRKLSRSGHAV